VDVRPLVIADAEAAEFDSVVNRAGRTTWIVDAHRDDGKRFVVRADDKLTAFLELESATKTASCTALAECT